MLVCLVCIIFFLGGGSRGICQVHPRLGLGYAGYANAALPIEAVHPCDNAHDSNRNWLSKQRVHM